MEISIVPNEKIPEKNSGRPLSFSTKKILKKLKELNKNQVIIIYCQNVTQNRRYKSNYETALRLLSNEIQSETNPRVYKFNTRNYNIYIKRLK